jgi:hypothetical protein
MAAIIYFILGCLAPLAAGPLAGLIFINILKRRNIWLQIPFWIGLLVYNLLIMLWVLTSGGKWLPISSLSAFIFTPIAAILTIPVMRFGKHRLEAVLGTGNIPKNWFRSGIAGIPVVQMLIFCGGILLAPWFCKIGLLICQTL